LQQVGQERAIYWMKVNSTPIVSRPVRIDIEVCDDGEVGIELYDENGYGCGGVSILRSGKIVATLIGPDNTLIDSDSYTPPSKLTKFVLRFIRGGFIRVWYLNLLSKRELRLRAQIAEADKDRALGVAASLDRSILIVSEQVNDGNSTNL
jgi:hypothetical protein